MIDKVLVAVAFARVPKRALKAVLIFACVAASALVVQPSFAVGTTPLITRVDTKDTNGDGYLDAVLVTFDTVMDTSIAAPNGFSVGGFTPGTPVSQWANNLQLQVNVVPHVGNGGDTSLRPAISYVKPATQKAKAYGTSSQEVDTIAIQGTDAKIVDAAGPVLMKALGQDYQSINVFIEAPDEMQFLFSEPVQINGQTAAARIAAFELAVKFSAIGVCSNDAQDANKPAGSTNFPSLKQGSTVDPIVEPVAGQRSSIVRVKFVDVAAHNASTINTPAIPGACGVGIDQTGAGNITDGVSPAPNNAVSQDFGGVSFRYRREVGIAPSNLSYDLQGNPRLATQDLTPTNGDGTIDAIAVTFDHNVVDESVTDALKSRFTIKSGGAPATVTSVTTGTTGDAIILVHIGGVQWGGGVKPTVSFDGSSCTLQTKVPAPGYSACAGSFGGAGGIQSLDKVPPAVAGSVALDNDKNGRIDTIRVDVTENVIQTATSAGWTVGGQAVTGLTGQGSSSLRLAITELPANGTGATPAVSYSSAAGNTTDLAGASMKTQTFTPADGAAPQALKATSLSSGNTATTDRVTIEFSESVTDALLDASDFTVDDAAATAFAASSLDATPVSNDKLVTIAVAKDGTGHAGLEFDGTLADAAGNLNADGFALAAPEVVDGAKPFVTSITTTPASPFGTGVVSVSATFSEPMDPNAAPVAKFGAKTIDAVADGDHTNGFRNTAPTIWDGTVTLVSGDCAQQNGCASTITLTGAKDTVGNVAVDATPLAVVADTVAPAAATGEVSSAQQEAGAISISENRIGTRTTNISVNAAITPGQLNMIGQTTGGSAELLIDGEPFNPAVTLTGISSGAGSVTLTTAFANAAALKSAIAEGSHTLTVNLCDSANNCTASSGVAVTADYTPVGVTLVGPNAGTFNGGDSACIQWSGDQAGNDFTAAELRYSLDGGATYPHQIVSGLPLDGSLACGAPGGGYAWTVPGANTTGLRVQVSTIDGYGNAAAARSASNMTVESITPTVLTLTASSGSLVYGAGTTLSGYLTGNDFAVAGKTVTIQRRTRGATDFATLTTVTTDGSGRYVYAFKPVANADYRAVFNGDGPYLASTSPLKPVLVAVAVASRINTTSLQRGGTFQINGWVLPAHAGKQVWFQAYQNGTWVTLAKQILTSRNYYQFSYRSTTARTLLFRVAFPTQDGEHQWNISSRYMATWK